jgi:hypothetical protein
MATRAVIAILQRTLLASPAQTVITVTIGAVLVAIAAFVAVLIMATVSSTA